MLPGVLARRCRLRRRCRRAAGVWPRCRVRRVRRGRCRRAAGVGNDSGSRDALASASRSGARGAVLRVAVPATAPEPVAASFRSGCVRQHGFVPRLGCGLERLPQDLPCPTFLRQPTAPPQTFPTPATRRHRSWHPSWRRLKARQLVVAATPRDGTRRLRCTVDATSSHGPANATLSNPQTACPADVARRHRSSSSNTIGSSHGDRHCDHPPPSRSDDGSGGGGCRGRGLFVAEPSADEGKVGHHRP